jgi:hypothetical protein
MIEFAELLAPVFAIGFMAGYGVRSLVSYRRRARSARWMKRSSAAGNHVTVPRS